MLEIFSYLYTRQEAIYNLRSINKRFHQYSHDPYLDNYKTDRATYLSYFEVRAPADLPYFKKMVKYGNIMQAIDTLAIDFFYDFGHYKTMFYL